MHRSADELAARLDHILESPSDGGQVEMIVRRPAEGERETLGAGILDIDVGLVGDNWSTRGNAYTEDGRSDPLAQITIMNSRAAAAVGGDRSRWPLAGDQIFVDMDISHDNLPAGSRVRIGDAVVEISPKPHTGCAKFASRYGSEALRFVNFGPGKDQRLRGVNAFVVENGGFAVGDGVRKI